MTTVPVNTVRGRLAGRSELGVALLLGVAGVVVLVDALTKMHASQGWKDEMEKRGWTDAFVTGDAFGTFLKEQDASVAEILTTLGLAS